MSVAESNQSTVTLRRKEPMEKAAGTRGSPKGPSQAKGGAANSRSRPSSARQKAARRSLCSANFGRAGTVSPASTTQPAYRRPSSKSSRSRRGLTLRRTQCALGRTASCRRTRVMCGHGCAKSSFRSLPSGGPSRRGGHILTRARPLPVAAIPARANKLRETIIQ